MKIKGFIKLTALAMAVFTINSISASEFAKGVDVSNLYDIEADGAKFYDSDGTQKDMLSILASHGVSWIRLRVWNDPESDRFKKYSSGGNQYYSFYNYGMCTVEKAAAIGKRARDLGMNILLDFHYSDTWTDPQYQRKPAAWDNLSKDQLVQALAEFTADSLKVMDEAGARPQMVQLGNEINTGLLKTTSRNSACNVTGDFEKSGSISSRLLNAGAKAVKDFDSSITVMLHFAEGGNTEIVKWCLENVDDVNFDCVGLSYYPFILSHNSPVNLGKTVKFITEQLKKRCIVAETSFPWTCEWVNGKNDTIDNTVWYSKDDCSLVQAYQNLKDIAQEYSIKTGKYDGKKTIEASKENQKAVMSALKKIVAQNGGEGLFYWGGEWIVTSTTNPKKGSTWENQALFDLNHKALPVLDY